MTDQPHGLRVHIDGSQHPIHDNVQALTATLNLGEDGSCQVLVGRVGSELVINVAGAVYQDRDARGHVRLIVAPPEPGHRATLHAHE